MFPRPGAPREAPRSTRTYARTLAGRGEGADAGAVREARAAQYQPLACQKLQASTGLP